MSRQITLIAVFCVALAFASLAEAQRGHGQKPNLSAECRTALKSLFASCTDGTSGTLAAAKSACPPHPDESKITSCADFNTMKDKLQQMKADA